LVRGLQAIDLLLQASSVCLLKLFYQEAASALAIDRLCDLMARYIGFRLP
jgi:hypothetical protein